ncbi:13180_t:CDS:2 [Cetraspora pellucida]|uniref:13180_t:CDS:1 n=1 Tax=Cetraspora pellucida TaxID=1433469 RepID=A0ACA9KJH3_9GLOM|nr:13180_t:CDS:2 [Cetraspora pellucida]
MCTILCSALEEETNFTSCTEYLWTIKNPVTATIKFNDPGLKGSFSLYDNMEDSGTQVSGRFVRGVKLNKPQMYKFTAHIHSTCDNIHENNFFEFDVSHSFLPKKFKAINDRKFEAFKTTSFSWYFGSSVPIAVVAQYKKSKIWTVKSCANLVVNNKRKDRKGGKTSIKKKTSARNKNKSRRTKDHYKELPNKVDEFIVVEVTDDFAVY